jgi:phosphoribosylformylglycinamidine (FGAM) synthase-like enzyme
VAEGGLATCLAEMAAASGVGARVAYDDAYDESPGRVVLCVPPGVDVEGTEIGVAGGDRLVIGPDIDLALDDVVGAWRDRLPSAMRAAVTH